jgi:peptidase A4-like protein
MNEPDPSTTAPQTPASPPPAKKAGGWNPMRLLAIGLLAFAFAAFTGRLDLASVVSATRGLVAPTPAARTTSSTRATDPAAVAAIKDVIQRANQAQAQAFARSDDTLMRDTATDSYYQELVQTNRDLANGGVSSIALANITWGDISVSGTTAEATTFETWRSSYTDGSTDQRTDRNEYTLVQQSGAWKIAADAQPDSRVIEPGTGTAPSVTQPGTPAAVLSRSSNWSGYAATGSLVTSVTGSWIVPTVSSTSAGADATWVGIGGLTGRDLIQAGTQAMVSANGTVEYSAWTEMLPQSSRTVPLEVRAGDAVTVTLTQQSGTNWLITINNDTTKENYSVTMQYSSSNSSAEWIQEAPSAGRGIVPLDQFGTLRFTAGSAVVNGKSQSLADLGARAITMINGAGQAIAQPSVLGSDGSSFTVTRTDAPSTTTGGRRGRP